MKSKFFSYLDDFHNITIIMPYDYRKDISQKFYLHNGLTLEELVIDKIFDLGTSRKYELISYDLININRDYSVYDDKKEISYLNIGAITRTSLFDTLYYCDSSDLGITYTKEATIFKLWSPVAKEVEIELIDLNNKSTFLELQNISKGLWENKVNLDLEGYKYKYRVRVNETFLDALDPYAVSSDANGHYNYIIDLNKTYQFKFDKPSFSGLKTDMIISEAHIRDLTSMEGLKINNPKKFLGLLEDARTSKNNKVGLHYLKSLGVTHVQFMPCFDYGGVDEIDYEKSYNWGYNPIQYNVVEGSYSSNPNDPYNRINELKMVIDKCHELGLRVVLDVVYNHVYETENFSIEHIMPSYFFHYDNRGMLTNNSGCGNDTASNRRMVRKYIIDSCIYWIKNFNIDGFRFDLMGLMDIETINLIEKKAYDIDKTFMIYGEGWNMNSMVSEKLRSNMNNHMLQPYISFFNDSFRDNIRKYAMNRYSNMQDIADLIMGYKLFYTPSQNINYVECHDNYTLYDYYKVAGLSESEIKFAHKLATSIVILSLGASFLQVGQTFYRTKKLVENSYMSNDEINFIDWNKKDENADYTLMVKDLISIKKKYKVFRLDSFSQVKNHINFIKEVSNINHLHFIFKDIQATLYMIVKNNNEDYVFNNSNNWIMIFDGKKKIFSFASDFKLNEPGVYLFLKGGE